MRTMIAVVLFLIPFTLASGQRKPQWLDYSSVRLRLGDEEKTTVDKLQNNFKTVTKFGKNPNPHFSEYVVSKSDGEIVGVVTFVDGTLSKAYRDWSPLDDTAYGAAMAVRGIVEIMQNDGPCELSIGSVKEPNYSNEGSFISCGQKLIEVSGLKSSQLNNGKPTVTIYEWINDGRDSQKRS